jgi:tetratricopeptide (TPR) repeat protein
MSCRRGVGWAGTVRVLDRFCSGRDLRTVKVARLLLVGIAWMVLGRPGVAAGRVEDSGGAWVEVRSPHFVVESNASEGQARGVAEDFEEIRALFHGTFPELRVDPAQPIVILAARDEATMKTLAPEEWGGEEHVRPSGLFHSDGDKDYVVLRLDAVGTTAYHTIYHEYTHALLHLNFSRLPLWLSEGVAEFFGNSTIGEGAARTGTVDKGHLYILGKNDWLPVETLLDVNESSTYYNEKNPASVFYAESWAVVHYLLLDPEARRQQLLRKFLVNWNLSGDRVTAGRGAFGDLGRFEETVKRYVRQANWRIGVELPGPARSAGDFSVRTLAPPEVLTLRGDFFVHRKRMDAALPLLEQGVALGPEIAATHEALGFYDFRDGDFAAAEEEMSKAVSLGSASFMAFYCHGVLLLRDFSATEESTKKARAALETAAKLNPTYAPTFEALTQAYSRTAETQGRAMEAAETAVKLDPESRTYQTNLAYVLLNNRRAEEARAVGERLERNANSLEEKRTARSILTAIEEEEEWEKESAEEALGRQRVDGPQVATGPDMSVDIVHPTISRRQLGPPEWMAVEGAIGAIDCSHNPEVTLSLNLPKGPMDFHASDFGHVGMSGIRAESVPELGTCQQWAGRRVKVWFRLAQGKDYLGEIIRIYFY